MRAPVQETDVAGLTDDDQMFVEQNEVEAAVLARAAQRGRPVEVAVVMMQRDEALLLDPWLRYHATVFGASNLTVLDNGSTNPGVLQRLEQAESEGVRVIRDYAKPQHAAARGPIITEVLRGLEPGADFLMPLDVGEFVAHQAPDGKVDCTPDPILNLLSKELRGTTDLLLIRGSYLNLPGMPGFHVFKNERRCFFARGAFGSIGQGYHDGRTPDGEKAKERRTALVHVHYRFPPFADLTEARRRLLDAPAKHYAAEGLRGFRGAAAEAGSFETMDQAQYEAFFRRFDRMPLSSLRNALRRLGSELPY